MPTETRFYYPDASIVCQPNPQSETFQDAPAVLFEVVSAGTRRIDEGEKRDCYLTIPSLSRASEFRKADPPLAIRLEDYLCT